MQNSPISASNLNRNDLRIQGVEDSSELKNEYRISNKEFRIKKFSSIFIRLFFVADSVLFIKSLTLNHFSILEMTTNKMGL